VSHLATTLAGPQRPPIQNEEEHRSFWNGIEHAYIPAPTLRIPDGLKLQTDATEDLDPITFEVVRHSLWNANAEHGAILANLAVSPILLETRDFQTAILSESGELLFFGPYLQYLAGFMDIVVHYIIEHHGERIRPGDMWLVNDPWIGTAHQPDVNLLCPVFVDGELFCWVANNAHQNDVGGTLPGSFCPNAQDIYYDPICLPPLRIVKEDRIDPEIEALYRRQSRTPISLALDLRASIAGNHAARERIVRLVERYGKETVKGVMRGVLDASQSSFKELLATIPDGEWAERCYQEVALSGDRGAYRVELRIRKQGDRLTVTNEGTDPQVGAINLPFAGLRGTTLATINVLAVPEHMGVIGGAVRQIDFQPVPGTLTCPDYGVAVSPAGIFATELGMAMSNSIVTKMLLCSNDESVRAKALAPTPGQWHIHIHAGTNQRGVYYVGPMLDAMIGTTGATSHSDGTFANGVWWIPEGRGPNVEAYERDWPVLYLYRREDPDSGGAGRWRGGNGGRLAYIPHNGELAAALYTSEGIPKSPGIFGGTPGNPGVTRLISGSDVQEQFQAGKLPGSVDELSGKEIECYGKGEVLPLDDASVLEYNWGGSAGYGDPLQRALERVFGDVAAGVVSPTDAEHQYGVIIRNGRLDTAASQERRRQMLRQRLAAAGLDREPTDAVATPPAGDLIIAADIWVDASAESSYRCAHCGEELGALSSHPKQKMARIERPLADVGERFHDPAVYVDDELIWREFFCPGCAARLATEVCRPSDEVLTDIRLEL
jgi:N-methylhydantoinase B